MPQPRRHVARRRARGRALGASGAIAAASVLGLALVGMPVAWAGPLPSLPVSLPSLPLPSLPLPSLPVPSLPSVPVPSLPLPTSPLPSLPLPSVPISTASPAPSGGAAVPSGSTSPSTSTAPAASAPAAAASSTPGVTRGSAGGPTVDQGPSPFQFVLPLLIAGVPIALIVAIVILQIAGGAAWLPVIRRWLNRTPTAGP